MELGEVTERRGAEGGSPLLTGGGFLGRRAGCRGGSCGRYGPASPAQRSGSAVEPTRAGTRGSASAAWRRCRVTFNTGWGLAPWR